MKSQWIFPAFYNQLIPFQFLIPRQINEKFMYVSSLLIFICAKKKCAKKIAFRSIQLKFSNVEKENSICNFYAPFP